MHDTRVQRRDLFIGELADVPIARFRSHIESTMNILVLHDLQATIRPMDTPS